MRTYKMLYLLDRMSAPYGKIHTRSVNMCVWECQKRGYDVLDDYGFLPIGDGPLSQEILSDVCFLGMLGEIRIEDDMLVTNYSGEVKAIVGRVSCLYPDLVKVVDPVVKDMKARNLLLDEPEILSYWRSELDKLNIVAN
ncbi:MAG: hypothetical protein KAS11_01130 [Candidatus Aenigmarchaeota archaeon]|nr:hypothetical protein [Candidatus Aenigmarchaeota archaeon]